MGKISAYIGSQLGNPRGVVGKVVCRLLNTFNSKLYKNTVSLIDVPADAKVLDIGYGNGHLLKMIYKKNPVELYGIDISDDAVDYATKHNKKAAAAGKLHLSVGDCCDLKFEADTFDAVTSINTVYFWSDTVLGLKQIRGVLKDGAAFYNVVYTRDYLDKISYTQYGFKKFAPEDLMGLGKEAGFTDIEVKDIVKGKSFVVVYRK